MYYVAMSADGFIARSDGAVDWLDARPPADYGFEAFLQGIGTIVWGRRTFDAYGRRHGLAIFGKGKRHLVLTHDPAAAEPFEGVAFTAEPMPALARRLRSEPAGAADGVWVMGGADSAASLLEAGALDEVLVHVIPVLLRDGIPLFRRGQGDVGLRLRDAYAHPDGVVRLHYDVARPG